MAILPDRIDAYLAELNAHDRQVALDMEARARERGFPIIGPQVGRWLHQMVRIHRPTRVFELGSGFGYSALWTATALRAAGVADASVVLTDGSEDHCRDARANLERAGVADLCDVRCGDALELLAADPDERPIDLFFCDIDKEGYPDAFAPMMDRLRVGGLIIVDNMLWSGRPVAVREGDASADTPSTRGVIALTEKLFSDERLFTTLVPLRDGATMSLRVA